MGKNLFSVFFLCSIIVSFLFGKSANCPSAVSSLMPKNAVNVKAIDFIIHGEIDLATAREAANEIISSFGKANFGSLEKF